MKDNKESKYFRLLRRAERNARRRPRRAIKHKEAEKDKLANEAKLCKIANFFATTGFIVFHDIEKDTLVITYQEEFEGTIHSVSYNLSLPELYRLTVPVKRVIETIEDQLFSALRRKKYEKTN